MKRLLASALLLLSGCGWHAGLHAPAGARSVGIEAVRREGTMLERGLEPLMTDALSEAVSDWIDLPLVSPEQADLVVRAELLEFRRRGGVRTPDNELIETAVLVRARAVLYDRRSSSAGQAVTAQEWSGYALDDPSNEDAARDRAIRHVAVELILGLFEPSAAPESGEPP